MIDDRFVKRFDEAAAQLGCALSGMLSQLPPFIKAKTQEIRIRTGQPVVLSSADGELFLDQNGRTARCCHAGLPKVTPRQMEQAFACLCEYSVHSFQHEINHGFITIRGGHRAGFCGTAVLQEGVIHNIKDISSLNLRIARQHFGAADRLLHSREFAKGGGVLIAGPPACGKTTLLRDLARQLSLGGTGRILKVCVVDERGEIAGVYRGQPQNDLGPCCDCLDGYPKAQGILHALRCLSPDVILCDEIGEEEEIRAVEAGVHSGVRFVTSIHLGSIEELSKRTQAVKLLETGAFSCVAMLAGRDRPGQLEHIYAMEDEDEIRRTSADYPGVRRDGDDEIHAVYRPGAVSGSHPLLSANPGQ